MYYFKTFKRNKYWFDFFLLKRGWALLLLLQFLCKIVQTTWKKTLFFWQRLSPRYKCPVAACCGLGTRRWGGGAWGHSVSWQKLADQAPWRHVSHHHWESADRQTAGRWRWRRGEGEREKEREKRETGRKRCVTSGARRFTMYPRLLWRHQHKHGANSNLHSRPTATFK